MISTMEMATGQWERGDTVPDAPVLGNSTAYAVPPQVQAGLCEHEAAWPLHAGMPADLATQDLEDFLSRMAGPAH
ncbi:hypothetical protein SKTS_11270 [Sulfurimicrobium lacus]|uniref:Uncharacterized protein n=1 Tax=Sulfurimicrobium lacus TaxID=2715678 RepID=A0A6F8VAR7_9PROT|nr:hypothetical protein [Sulfurimicrobium lacus]BCB26241.1 hypothetical protein SKTS_11270 [Sulfurimicrobium lacus]